MGYPQQGWAGGPPGPPARKKTNPLVPILIVLVLVAGGVGAYFLLSGDDEESGGGGGPAAAAERYTQAFIDGDCGAIVDAMSIDSETAETFSTTCEAMFASEEATDEFPAELVGTTVDSESESTATVTVDYRTRGGNDDSETFDLVNEGGNWLVTAESAGLTGSGGGSDDTSTDDTGSDDTSSDTTSSDGGGSSAGEPTSPPLDDPEIVDDPALAGYAQGCYDGDMAACDDLWSGTDVGGVAEAYAESCGGRLPPASASGDCETILG